MVRLGKYVVIRISHAPRYDPFSGDSRGVPPNSHALRLGISGGTVAVRTF